MNQRQASAHTLRSYRDTFRLLLRFAQQYLNKPPSALAFDEIDAPLITSFLENLEKSRGITARSRNLRLTAIRSFFRYAAYEEPSRSSQKVARRIGSHINHCRISFSAAFSRHP